MQNYLGYKDIRSLENALKKEDGAFWEKRGQRMALDLFHRMAKRVPAYAKFLKKHKVRAENIRTIADFSEIPTTNKDNYLRRYSLEELSWDGRLDKDAWVISATSGSTGEPFYFPRTEAQDEQYALVAELYLRANFEIQEKSTLYINAFPLGIWIGGIFTYEAITMIARGGKYPLSIANPGINKQMVVKIVERFGKDFDQIIIGSYGPFLKDILDEGTRAGIKWKQHNIGFVFSAEGFSEEFRDYVLAHTSKKNPYSATLNHYGTVDIGTQSYETPLSVLVRREALKNPDIRMQIIREKHKLPTITQYIPELFFFEETKDHRLICSAQSGLPLVRYDLKDYGHVYTKQSVEKAFGKVLDEAVGKAGIKDTVWGLPFVQVFERTDFSVSLYAFQIYPETIRRALQSPSFRKVITGKFTMSVEYDRKQNQKLSIHIELMSGVKKIGLIQKRRILRSVLEHLIRESSEFQKTFAEKGRALHPNLHFWTNGHPQYFASGGKQKWVKK